MRICVYCASSQEAHPVYRDTAFELGALLAREAHTIVFGGSSVGSMGALADGALSCGGEVIGILPRFLADLELQHKKLAHLELVETMRERKHRLLAGSDAVVALPGGCGTLEELFEAITLKRLGIYLNPIVLLNTRKFFTPLLSFLDKTMAEHFMRPEHANMWQVASEPADVLPAIATAPTWRREARQYAVVGSLPHPAYPSK